MALILNIDTATEIAGISLSKEGQSLALSQNKEQKEHASWLHPAVEKMMQETGFRMRDLQAVAVTAGPGSYTGLRVWKAAAQGVFYSFNIPLIPERKLKKMAFSARGQNLDARLFCPLIDAPR